MCCATVSVSDVPFAGGWLRLSISGKHLSLKSQFLLSFSVNAVGNVESGLGSVLLGFSGFGGSDSGVFSDGSVAFLPHVSDTLGFNSSLGISGEFRGVNLGGLLSESGLVVSNVLAEKSATEGSAVEFAGGLVETGESLLAVGDVKSSINGSLHGSEHSGTSGGVGQTNIQDTFEWSYILILGELLGFASDFLGSGVFLVQLEFVENSSCNQQTGGVACSVVGQTNLSSVEWELVRVSSLYNNISLDSGEDNLADDIVVGQSNNQSVFRAVVLVFVLED